MTTPPSIHPDTDYEALHWFARYLQTYDELQRLAEEAASRFNIPLYDEDDPENDISDDRYAAWSREISRLIDSHPEPHYLRALQAANARHIDDDDGDDAQILTFPSTTERRTTPRED